MVTALVNTLLSQQFMVLQGSDGALAARGSFLGPGQGGEGTVGGEAAAAELWERSGLGEQKR